MIVAGFGFRAGAGLPSLRAAFEAARSALAGDQGCVTHLATARDKLAQLAPLADELGLPLHGASPALLATMPTFTRSARSLDARGTGSLAEASALAAIAASAGPALAPALIVTRRISPDRMATCAIAQGMPS